MKNQIRTNLVTNILTMFVHIGVGIYYTPYLVEKLGIIAYGVIPLAAIINQYINVITGSLTAAFSRFYSISIQRKNIKRTSDIISTSITVITIISFVVASFIILLISNIDKVFTIPDEYILDAKYLFAFTFISFIIALYSSLLNVTLYAQNRLDLINVFKICRILLKFVLIVILFSIFDVNIFYIGLSSLVLETIILIISLYFYLKYRPFKVKIKLFKLKKYVFYSIMGMTTWTIIHQIGDVFLYRVDNIIVNKLWGMEYSSRLGAISDFATYVAMAASVIGGLFGPLILIAYANNKHNEVRSLALNQSFIVGSIVAVISGIISGSSADLLILWLGEEFAGYEGWLIIKMVSIPFFAAGGILAFVYRSWNQVKAPAITTLVLGFIVFIIIYILSILDINSINLTLVIFAFFVIIQSYIMNIYYVNKIYKGTYSHFTKSALKMSLTFLISFYVAKEINNIISFSNLYVLFIFIGLSSAIVFVFVFYIFFDKIQKNALMSLIKSKI